MITVLYIYIYIYIYKVAEKQNNKKINTHLGIYM
jgi:hypothetical protein